MDFTGRYEIPATAQTVWDGLNDPAVLKACIPGCEEIAKTSPTEFLATATLKIGPVKARFKGKVSLSDLQPPDHCVLAGEGQGGMAGFAKGMATIELAPAQAGAATVLSYTAKATVGGKLAQIGQRLIDGAAKQIADDFFARFSSVVGASGEPAAAKKADSAAFAEPLGIAAAAAPETDADGRSGIRSEVWVVGLIGVVVILLLLFSVAL